DADALAGARGAQDAVVEPEEIADALHHVGLVVDDEDAVPPRRLHPWIPQHHWTSEQGAGQRSRPGAHCQSDGVVPLNLVPTERAENSVPRRFPYPAILAAVGLFLVPAAQADGPTRKQVACMLALNAAGAHVAAVSVAAATR